MAALLRLLFAFFARSMPFLSVAGTALSAAFSIASAFVSSVGSRLWYWALYAGTFLIRFFPVILFFTGIVLVSNLLLSLVVFVLYHVNAFLTLGLAPFVTSGTVLVIVNAVLGVLAVYLIRLAVFLGSAAASAVPVPQAPPS